MSSKCKKCGEAVSRKERRGGVYATTPENFMKSVQGVGYICEACNKVFCKTCSHQAARDYGKSIWTCPDCGARCEFWE